MGKRNNRAKAAAAHKAKHPNPLIGLPTRQPRVHWGQPMPDGTMHDLIIERLRMIDVDAIEVP